MMCWIDFRGVLGLGMGVCMHCAALGDSKGIGISISMGIGIGTT